MVSALRSGGHSPGGQTERPQLNPYEAPGGQETKESCERNFFHFCMLAQPASRIAS
jgi:hypothetical protein